MRHSLEGRSNPGFSAGSSQSLLAPDSDYVRRNECAASDIEDLESE